MKKCLSLVLALLMVLSLGSIAMAEGAEPVTLTVLFHYNNTLFDAVAAKQIEEAVGVKFEPVYIPRETAAEKFNLLVQSDELPDIILNAQSLAGSASMLYKLGAEGVFLDLTEPMAQYAPTLTANYEKYPDLLKVLTSPDGAVYSLAKSYPLYDSARNNVRAYIETSWLENLGLEMPTTADELFDVLMAFKEQDANGNGDPNDEIPFVFHKDDNNLAPMTYLRGPVSSAFTHTTQNDWRILDEEGNVQFLPATDGYRELISFYKKLYDNGLLYGESFTQDINTVWSLNEQSEDVNTIGFAIGAHRNIVCTWDSKRWMDYEPLFYLTDEDGEAHLSAYLGGNFESNVSLNGSLEGEKLEAAMRVLDYIATPEGSFLVQRGILGENIMPADEGALTVYGTPAYWRTLTEEETAARGADAPAVPMTNHFNFWITEESHIDDVQTAADADPREDWAYYHEGYDRLYYTPMIKNADLYWPASLFMSIEGMEQLALIQTDLVSYVETANIEFITGKRDIETDWDKYLADLEKMGLATYLEVSQKEYDNNK